MKTEICGYVLINEHKYIAGHDYEDLSFFESEEAASMANTKWESIGATSFRIEKAVLSVDCEIAN